MFSNVAVVLVSNPSNVAVVLVSNPSNVAVVLVSNPSNVAVVLVSNPWLPIQQVPHWPDAWRQKASLVVRLQQKTMLFLILSGKYHSHSLV
jgi:hypothetical protein